MAGWGDGAWGLGTWGNGETILTGDDATGAVGSVTADRTVALTGVDAAGAVDAVAMGERTVALTGVSALGEVGDVTETNNPTEDGVLATGSVATVASSRTVAISGVQASGQVGTANYFYWTTIDDSQTPNWQNVEMVV